VMNHAQVDKQAYDDLVKRILKGREDAKKNQRNYYATLCEYGIYGPRNSYRDIVSEQQLKNTDPQVFVDLVKKLGSYEHSVDYYGPLDVKEVTAIIDKTHQTAKKLQAVPQNNYYVKQVANQNEVWIAPYDAKNIYMRAYHHENRDWKIGEAAVQAVFNEYFGGGMNGIVFQEMREARGLAYNASALYSRPGRKGEKESFYTHIITQNDKMMDCINHFHQIMNELPASENAFNIAKEGLTKQLASLRTTKMGIISKWHSMKELGLDYDLNQRIYEGLGKVTLQDVVNFEKANMADKPLRYLILGDEKELDVKSLEKIGSIRRLTTEEVFGY
jgi:predicted Zn-dependent peptidase